MAISGISHARANTQRNGFDGWTAAGIVGTVGVGALAATVRNPLIAVAAAGIGAATLFHAMQTHSLAPAHVVITKSDTAPVTSHGRAAAFASEYTASVEHITPTPGSPDAKTYEAMWRQDGPGWLGSDGAISTRLPDGRMLWLFGDTFMGSVQPDRKLAPGWHFPRNTVVVQDADKLTTLTRRAADGSEASFLEPTAHPGQWYWPTTSVVDGDKLHVIANRYYSDPNNSGAWNWVHDGTDVVTLHLPDLAVMGTREIVSGPSVGWGDALISDADHTYVYGNAGSGLTSDIDIMRFPKNNLDAAPEVWDGTQWNKDISKAAVVAGHDVANFAVEPLSDGTYSMINMAPLFGKDIYARNAPTPQGPWGPPRKIGERAEIPADVFSYGLYVDKQGSTNDKLLVNYSVNGDIKNYGVDYYRPRFLTLNQRDLVEPDKQSSAKSGY